MPQLEVINLSKKFGKVIAVDNVSFMVKEGEILSLLGPSGCGKTTTLRMLAGLTLPSSGKILLDGRDITLLPPEKRNMGMVFQNYAVWPHMNVYENVAFPLEVRKISKEEISQRVKRALEMVRLYELRDRYPHQLSGGQQQRVAIARALAVQPEVLLLDEPLSNLDAKLREEMRVEIKELQRSLKITTVYVTHDQIEALSLSDRIAVMNEGKIVQLATPKELYDNPANDFVASFIGKINMFNAIVKEIREDCKVLLEIGPGLAIYARPQKCRSDLSSGARVIIGIRPKGIRVYKKSLAPQGKEGRNIIEGKLKASLFLGEFYEYLVEVREGIRFKAEGASQIDVGEEVLLEIDEEKIYIF